MVNITAIVHTKNSAKTLGLCLDSLKWLETVLVIDMKSSDETQKIADTYSNVKWFSHPDVGYVEPARNFALQKVSSDWTLIVDADEEVSPQLAQKLQEIVNEDSDTSIYFLPRKNIIFNEWISHTGWWPDYQLRFFKTGTVQWPNTIHGQPQFSVKTELLSPKSELAIVHHNYQTIEQFVDRLNRYTSIEVENGQNAESQQSIDELPNIFSQELSRRFFVERGIHDKRHGLALSYLQSFYQIIIALKVWQKNGFEEERNQAETYHLHLDRLQKSVYELKYWIATYHLEHSSGIQKLIWKVRRKIGV